MSKFLYITIYWPLIVLICIFIVAFYFIDIIYLILALCNFEASFIKDTYEGLPISDNIKRIFISALFSMIYLKYKRNKNGNKIFNSGNIYFDVSNIYLWVATHILGYKKISLKFIPVALQFKILIDDFFEETIPESHPEVNQQVNITYKNVNTTSDSINFILSDTYEIKENMIPESKNDLPTIIIDNYLNAQGQRIYNEKFIQEIKRIADIYSQDYKKVNIFATTNTMHNKNIVNYCFKNAGRVGFEEIYVFKQSNKDTFDFDDVGYKVL
ncbi:hypothetical protein [Lysinibacillus fusiformis]|uniref:hypothetical protein n=1 Tax=Lysinibacillus fusiformis TaxID=28031 RepID=UPI0023A92F5D|nr:hypothetical protein [Lysinibacillus fusiformis]WEA41640.1 hypothetical protein PWJ66_23160 [Lysinibacillus fusiformis]